LEGASGWRGCGSGARGGHPAACAAGRGGGHGAEALASPPAPPPTVCVTGKKPERKGIRPDRRVPHVSGCGVGLVVSGLAGCVGPQGMVGCGFGEPEEGFEVV
jgi:hypothetical protein